MSSGTLKRKPSPAEMTFLLTFHALLSGAFLVTYLTGDEDTYGMHVFAGYTLLVVLALRLAAALLVPAGSPLALPRPAAHPVVQWLGRVVSGDEAARRGRSPLLAWMAAALLAVMALAGLSGVAADAVTRLEHLHEALGALALWLVIGHILLVIGLHGLKHLRLPALSSPHHTHGVRP